MRTKKIAIILIAVIFAVALIFCIGAIFTVKKVDTVFCVSEDTKLNVDGARETLDKYVGKNLLFLDTEDVEEALRSDSYLEVISVKKQFPNIIKVEVKERKEVYTINFDEKTYALDENGLVLSELKEIIDERNYIKLELDSIKVISANEGFSISTDAPEMLTTTFEIAKNLRLTDCIKTVTVINKTERQEIKFGTYTAVDIVITKALEDGVAKAEKAFEIYDNETQDYIKTYNEIISYKQDNGEIVAVWTKHGA